MEDKNTHKTTEIRLSDKERSLLASLSGVKETVKISRILSKLTFPGSLWDARVIQVER